MDDSIQVSMEASELDIPGLYLIHDFISAKEEEVRDLILRENPIGIYTVLIFFSPSFLKSYLKSFTQV